MAKNGNIHPTRNIQEPKKMLELWNDFKEDLKVKELEWKKVQYVGKEGERVTDPVKIPYTFEGFKRYCWDIEIGDVEQYFLNRDSYYDDFISICSRIKNEIRENQIIGGMNGFFNASITQRLNNIKEQVESSGNLDHTIKFT